MRSSRRRHGVGSARTVPTACRSWICRSGRSTFSSGSVAVGSTTTKPWRRVTRSRPRHLRGQLSVAEAACWSRSGRSHTALSRHGTAWAPRGRHRTAWAPCGQRSRSPQTSARACRRGHRTAGPRARCGSPHLIGVDACWVQIHTAATARPEGSRRVVRQPRRNIGTDALRLHDARVGGDVGLLLFATWPNTAGPQVAAPLPALQGHEIDEHFNALPRA